MKSLFVLLLFFPLIGSAQSMTENDLNSKATTTTLARTTAKLIYSENNNTKEELVFDVRQGVVSDEAGTAHKQAIMDKFRNINCSTSLSSFAGTQSVRDAIATIRKAVTTVQ